MTFFTDESRCRIASLELSKLKGIPEEETLPETMSTDIRVIEPRFAANTFLGKLQPRGGSHIPITNTYLHGVFNRVTGEVDLSYPVDRKPGKCNESLSGTYNGMLSNYFTPLADIKKAYKQFCSDEKMNAQPFDINCIRGALNELKLVEADVIVQVKTDDGVVPKLTTVLFGLKLV